METKLLVEANEADEDGGGLSENRASRQSTFKVLQGLHDLHDSFSNLGRQTPFSSHQTDCTARTYATHTGWAPVVPEAHPPNLSRIRKRQLSPKRFKLGRSIYICQGVHREAVDAHDVRQMSGQTLADAVYDRDASEW
ncbi:hypothetical protein QR685DRAFT_156778 [Neurospora intermedia]|uniref:Uncharacterized protein n=1 Tax=Neurospora intermedia TaxID=5142 RepID=A0ABR3DJT3_NEUIN